MQFFGSFNDMAAGMGQSIGGSMAVFNSNSVEQSSLVFNMDWSGFARSSDVEKAAGRVTGSLDRATKEITKAVTDVSRDAKGIADAVKTGSERVVDAVGKIKNEQNIEQTDNQPASRAVSVVSAGLDAVADSTAQLADRLRSHPHEFRKVSESMEGIGKKFNDLVHSTSEYARINERLQKTVADVSQASNWIGGNYSGEGCGGTSNGGRTQTFPVG